MADTPSIDAHLAELEAEGWQVQSRRNRAVEGVPVVAAKVVDDPQYPAWTLYLHEFGFQIEPYANDRSRWGGWLVSPFTDHARALLPVGGPRGHGIVLPNLAGAAKHVAKLTGVRQ